MIITIIVNCKINLFLTDNIFRINILILDYHKFIQLVILCLIIVSHKDRSDFTNWGNNVSYIQVKFNKGSKQLPKVSS